MSMLETFQGGYEIMRYASVCADDTVLDGETAGYTFKPCDRPTDIVELPSVANGCEVLFYGTCITEGEDYEAKIYGYAPNGPAEFICDICATMGQAEADTSVTLTDVSDALYADTLTILSQAHINTVTVHDAAAGNRVAKLRFDVMGYKYLYCEFPDVSDAVNAKIRYF